ncbi:hypothetical protein QR680_004918 [Steinernema hermaphroditum]|uniref:Uncharacterized protein n=1 Tax=Steinernema hermaphroditum TaxID=289476 RepID=A0AA39HRG8_9BILA|nr:hypothetical protein QR680_004918 [Steinernema hermaphroditum]
MVYPLLFVFFLCPVAESSLFNVTGFHCGKTIPEKFISVLGAVIMCPLGAGSVQRCCQESNNCYGSGGGWDLCEDVYCQCIEEIVQSTKWCSTELSTTCTLKTPPEERPSAVYSGPSPSKLLLGVITVLFYFALFFCVLNQLYIRIAN